MAAYIEIGILIVKSLPIIAAVILYIATGGAIFKGLFEKHPLASGAAGIVALAMAAGFWWALVDPLFRSKENPGSEVGRSWQPPPTYPDLSYRPFEGSNTSSNDTAGASGSMPLKLKSIERCSWLSDFDSCSARKDCVWGYPDWAGERVLRGSCIDRPSL